MLLSDFIERAKQHLEKHGDGELWDMAGEETVEDIEEDEMGDGTIVHFLYTEPDVDMEENLNGEEIELPPPSTIYDLKKEGVFGRIKRLIRGY